MPGERTVERQAELEPHAQWSIPQSVLVTSNPYIEINWLDVQQYK
jgi:hypothetical protein